MLGLNFFMGRAETASGFLLEAHAVDPGSPTSSGFWVGGVACAPREDRDLLDLIEYEATRIVRAHEFLDRLKENRKAA